MGGESGFLVHGRRAGRRPGCFLPGLACSRPRRGGTADGGTARASRARRRSPPAATSVGAQPRFLRRGAARSTRRPRSRRLPVRPAAACPPASSRCSGCHAKRRQRERGEREESEQHGARDADLAETVSRQEAGNQPDRARGESSAGPRRGRGRPACTWVEHADDVRHQHAEPDDQDRRPLHVESAEPVEAGEREPDAEQRNPERAGAEAAARARGRAAADRAGERDREQGEPDEEADDQRGERAEPAAAAAVGREPEQPPGDRDAARRSWKRGSTG